MSAKKYKVVGIGNAVVDILADVEDDFIKKHNLRKGSMRIIDELEIKRLHLCIKAVKELSGGSAANTIAAMSSLGNRVAFIGKVGNDRLGKSFEKDLKNLGVDYCTLKSESAGPTACCIVLTTPDAQRTMNTFLGISGFLNPEDIDENIISQSEVIYLEGYLWDSPEAKKAFEKAVRIAVKTGGKVSLNLSDSFCVKRHRIEFLNLIRDSVDILFANEEEIMSLFKTKNQESAVSSCMKMGKICVITRSEKGSIIISGGELINVPVKKNNNVIDTTGAGDLYAAGFLHGFVRGMDLKTCGRIGSVIASEILSQFGARLEIPLIELLNKRGLNLILDL